MCRKTEVHRVAFESSSTAFCILFLLNNFDLVVLVRNNSPTSFEYRFENLVFHSSHWHFSLSVPVLVVTRWKICYDVTRWWRSLDVYTTWAGHGA